MSKSNKKKKVLVALSGGVDSAAAAVTLCDAGYDVVGVYMCLQDFTGKAACSSKACCTPQDAADAATVASKLGIELIVFDAMKDFDIIKREFIASYEAARTPNPCIRCNQLIKFGSLIGIADDIGADFIATGHYARILEKDGKPCLARAKTAGKDQSYALFNIDRKHLSRIIFPNGDLADKSETREIVRAAGLDVHDKPDSQDICFVPDGNLRTLFDAENSKALKPGPIIDRNGKQLGTHKGYGLLTIGQRRGLNIAAGEPIYVCNINPETCEVTVGPKSDLMATGLKASSASWLCDVPDDFECDAQIRYGHKGIKAKAKLLAGGESDGKFEVKFEGTAFAVTPGQAAVLYKDEIVLGGGWIDEAIK